MNKILLSTKFKYALLWVISLVLGGCEKDVTPEADLSVNITEIVLKDNKLQTIDIEVRSNFKWSAVALDDNQEEPTWFYLVENTSDAGINTLSVTINESNPSYDSVRNGSIVINSSDKSITIPIKQPQKLHFIDVDKVIIEGEKQYFLRKDVIINLIAKVIPENATNKNISWQSSNPKIATVDNLGQVTALGYGTTKITATSEDGNKTESININVELYMAGDYYPDINVAFSAPGIVESGTMPIGIVLSTSNFGRAGILIALNETQSKWGPESTSINTSNSDGELNSSKIKNEYVLSDYPAFEYCAGITTGGKKWFFPAIDQVNAMYDLYNANRDALNSKMVNAGGMSFMSLSPWYSSSSEVIPGDSNWSHIVWMVSYGDRYNGHLNKNDAGNIPTVRSMTKF